MAGRKRTKSRKVPNFRKPNTEAVAIYNQHKLTSAKTIGLVERRYQVIELRKQGYTHKEIADTLEVSVESVSDDLHNIMASVLIANRETVEEERQLQIEQIDKMLKTYMPLATEVQNTTAVDRVTGEVVVVSQQPNPAYGHLVVSLMARRSKLLALDTPEQKETSESGIRVYVGVDMSKV